jgi:hypothetical protein
MKMNEKHFLLTFPTLECAEPTSPTRLSSPKSSQLRVRSLPQVFTKRPRSRLCRRVQLVLTLVSLQQGLHARFTFTSPPVMSSKSSEKSEKHCNELSGASRLAEAHMFVHFASSPFCVHTMKVKRSWSLKKTPTKRRVEWEEAKPEKQTRCQVRFKLRQHEAVNFLLLARCSLEAKGQVERRSIDII